MKFGLFIAFLVLLASTNVFGQRTTGNQNGLDTEVGEVNAVQEQASLGSAPVRGQNSESQSGLAQQTSNSADSDHDPSTRRKTAKATVSFDKETAPLTNPIKEKPVETPQVSEGTVHVNGNINLRKYNPSAVRTVQYDINNQRLTNGAPPSASSRSQLSQEYVARGSRVTLYVALKDTVERKAAFAQFPIEYTEDHFPLAFSVDVVLPSQQRDLIKRGGLTLYFFVYVNSPELHSDTFVPFGTSQIFLQDTNRLDQELSVNVRANGVEVSGLLRGRFGSQYIQSGTSFQIFIVSERNLPFVKSGTFKSVAQLTLTNLPAMFPVPWSLLVQQQVLQPDTNYYAVAFVNERDNRYRLPQPPVWVINDQGSLVLSQVIFAVVRSPFIFSGIVQRAMPGPYMLQSNSSLTIRIHETGAPSRQIYFQLTRILTLPQVFQLNISEALEFDPLKNYEIRALITDGKNNVYMSTLQSIPISDEAARMVVPVEDLLYYVHARLESSSSDEIRYIPGSDARLFITDTPETPGPPIANVSIYSIRPDFRDMTIQVPTTAILRDRNYYLVLMITSMGVSTHQAKILLISNNQPPPLVVQLPVLSNNLINGVLFELKSRPAQWSSSSFANIYFLDDSIMDPQKAIVQVWRIQLENDFPVRFQLHVDFSRLRNDRLYRLQSSIENGRNELEYRPAGSVLVLSPGENLMRDIRVPVISVKTFQSVSGVIYIDGARGPLPAKGEIYIQVSASPSLENPSIVEEIRIQTDGRELPVSFTIDLPLNKININSVYYFLIRYTVNNTIVVPVSQAFTFTPRAEATVVITLSQTPQIPITGQVTATGHLLKLPAGTSLKLSIIGAVPSATPLVYSQVTLEASSNNVYDFVMFIDSHTIQTGVLLNLMAEIYYEGKVILAMPNPALLTLTRGGEYNINLIIDLPTLLVGRIISLGSHEEIKGELDVYIQIVKAGTDTIVQTRRLRLDANLPQSFHVEVSNSLFLQYSKLEARAIIKNCREQVLFESSGAVEIHIGLNVKIDLTVVVTDRKKLTELINIDETAAIKIGKWQLSITGFSELVKLNDINGRNQLL